MFDQSPLIHNMLTSESHDMQFEVHGCQYDPYYLLTNGIYHEWFCFVQSFHQPQDERCNYFAERQEAICKDAKRCFGVLQARFAIIQNPCRHWSMNLISNIMFTCCILHNMILGDKEGVEGLDDIIGDLHEGNVPMQRGLSFNE